jgi:hypothetical protein
MTRTTAIAAAVMATLTWAAGAEAACDGLHGTLTTASALLACYDKGMEGLPMELIVSVTEGALGFANAELKVIRHEAPFYCPPSKLALTPAQTVNILRRWVEEDESHAGLPYGLRILRSLQETFPCKDSP